MVSMMTEDPRGLGFPGLRIRGEGGIEAKPTWPRSQGRGNLFLGNLFSAFCSLVYIKNRTFSDFSSVIFEFVECTF